MSHVTLSKAKISDTSFDLAAVEMACKMIGLEFVRDQTNFHWYGSWVNDYHAENAAYRQGMQTEDYGKCQHIIRLPRSMHEDEIYAQDPNRRPYEIGLVKQKDGTFGLAFDHFAGGAGVAQILDKVGGNDLVGLTKAISQCKITMQVAKQKGHYVKKVEDLGNGRTKVIVGIKQMEKL